MRDGKRFALFAAVLLNLTDLHAHCPLELEPPSVVVQYGKSLIVHCRALTTELEKISVEAAYGEASSTTQNATWNLESVRAWNIVAQCYVNLLPSSHFSTLQCVKPISVTIYKYPENVTITDNKGGLDIGDLDEGIPHVFRCNVKDVAPVQNMSVTWYIGNRTVQTNDNFADSEGPIDVQPLFSYEPRSEDNGLHIRCQVHFNLGPFGPHEHNTSQQHPLRIRYPPKNITQLEDTELEVGSSSTLKCFSEAYPALKYHWDYYKTGNVEVTDVAGGSHLQIQKATDVNIGNYTCIVANDLKNISKMARVTVKGANSQCPIEITPERLVMPYGGQSSVICGNSTEDASRNMMSIFWRVGQRMVPGAQWDLENDTDWDPRAECIATFSGIGECSKRFDVTFYKMADKVLIHSVGDTGPMVAEREYQLQCDILNVAPVQNLTVSWYRGNDRIKDQGSLRVTGCPHQNKVDCDNQVIRSPVNVSSTISIILKRNEHGAQFRCEAQLALEQQPLAPMMSHPLSLSVHYDPIINISKLPSSVPVFSGYPAELVCEADGRPAPDIHWFSKDVRVSSGNLTVTEAGVWTCNATNVVGSNIRVVEVVLKEDYLPLIAGLVAATVFVISVVFIFFYSIYYKNTKMRRYSLKNPKLNTLNGNIAHNSWDSPLPMTKLS